MEVKGLAHFGLEVSNVEKSSKFYTEVFRGKELKRLGFSEEELKKGRTRHVMVKIGSMVVALFESRDRGKLEPRGIAPNDPTTWSSWRHFAFTVEPEQFEDWVRYLSDTLPRFDETADGPKAHGGGSNGLSIYFDDPDGYHLELNAYYPTREAFQQAHIKYGRVFGGAKGENYTWTDEDEKKHYGRV
ncbi:MAG: VOC family protein [Deltaproteobacteria bacterium]|nr:VOC family protein [Deltaproteobacteria bacterium]